MTDRQRIEAMCEAGTISADEAQSLLEAIGASPTATEAIPHAAQTLHSAAPAAPTASLQHWCTIELLAASLEIRSAAVAAPQLEGDEDLILTPSADGARVSAAHRGGLPMIGLDRLGMAASLLLPSGWGVALDLKAGEITVRDIPCVRGQMLAGSLRVINAEWVDLLKLAGDIDVQLRPTAGDQRIQARAGSVNVELLPNSDVTVSAEVTVGDLSAAGYAVTERGMGAWTERIFGHGTARLAIRVTVGELLLRGERTAVA